MRLVLRCGDATSIESDVQVVKHFDGWVGGSEAAINQALRGSLRPVFTKLEKQRPPASRLVLTDGDRVASTRLLVVGLGKIDRFSLDKLQGAIELACRVVVDNGFASMAMPVIGASSEVGLPIVRAYRTVLASIFLVVAEETASAGVCTLKTLSIFDKNEDTVAVLDDLTEAILHDLGITWQRISQREFDVEVGSSTKKLGEDLAKEAPETATEAAIPRAPTGRAPTKVLFLSATPIDADRLRVEEEIREIDEAIRGSEYRDQFDIRQQSAVRVIDLQAHLLRHRPQIVHFSGHGTEDGRLMLEDANGNCVAVPRAALTRLFGAFTNIRCVVLNVCFSQEQAEGIATSVDCVVGMSSSIGDVAAIGFARAFYQALAFGCSVSQAFELGSVQVGLADLPDEHVPQLLLKEAIDASLVSFATPTP